MQCGKEDSKGNPYPGHCPRINRNCVKWYGNFPNEKAKRYCEKYVPCSDCESVSIM